MSKPRHAIQAGFTLVELLIVVIILAILAAIVVPQFGSSTEDAKVSTLKADLAQLRNAIELYYHQHNSTYPGQNNSADGTDVGTDTVAAATSFVEQLTLYTDKTGQSSTTKDSTFRFGPYLKTTSLPDNPFIADPATVDDVTVDLTETDITVTSADGSTGWKFYANTGRFIANDDTTLSDGSTETETF